MCYIYQEIMYFTHENSRHTCLVEIQEITEQKRVRLTKTKAYSLPDILSMPETKAFQNEGETKAFVL